MGAKPFLCGLHRPHERLLRLYTAPMPRLSQKLALGGPRSHNLQARNLTCPVMRGARSLRTARARRGKERGTPLSPPNLGPEGVEPSTSRMSSERSTAELRSRGADWNRTSSIDNAIVACSRYTTAPKTLRLVRFELTRCSVRTWPGWLGTARRCSARTALHITAVAEWPLQLTDSRANLRWPTGIEPA